MNKRGFTLVELLVVIAVMGVAASLGTEMFIKMSSSWRQTAARAEFNRRADAIFAALRKDFSEIVSDKLAAKPLVGTSKTSESERFYRIPLEDDQVGLAVTQAVGTDGYLRPVRVQYRVDRKEGSSQLVREATLTDAPTMGGATKVADGVLAFALEYLGRDPGSAWEKEWNKPGLPSAVRVSVTLGDAPDYVDQVSRKSVFSIRVD